MTFCSGVQSYSRNIISITSFKMTKVGDSSGLYYKPITIININKLETLLTDNARVINYDWHMFIVQATAFCIITIACVNLTLDSFCDGHCHFGRQKFSNQKDVLEKTFGLACRDVTTITSPFVLCVLTLSAIWSWTRMTAMSSIERRKPKTGE